MCFGNEGNHRCAVHFGIRFRIDPARADINQHKNIQSFLLVDHPMDGVDLYQIARIHGRWALHVRMIPFEKTPLFHEACPVDRASDRVEGYLHSLVQQLLMHHFTRAFGLLADMDDLLDDIFRELFRMVVRL